MAPSTKRRNRILILLGVLAAVVVGAAVWYRAGQARLDELAVNGLKEGKDALVAHDYETALDRIGRYLQRFSDKKMEGDDKERAELGETYRLYAAARRKVELANSKHLIQAITALRTALRLDPSSVAIRTDLLDASIAADYRTEALDLIDSLLVKTPNDLRLLRMKSELLESLRRFPESLAVAKAINELAKDDLGDHFRTLRILLAAGTPVSDVDTWIEKTLAAHAADPRFELLRADLLTRRNDLTGAAAILDRILAANT